MKSEPGAIYQALVADDSESVRNLVIRALESEGIDCDTASDGTEAMELCAQNTYDIVISDLRMPNVHGHELLSRLIESDYSGQLVAITGIQDPRIVRDLLTRGVSDCFIKPFDYKIFAIKIRAMLNKRQAAAQRAEDSNEAGALSAQLDQTTSILEKQLAAVTEKFQVSIDGLKRQRDALRTGYLGSVRVLANLVEQVGDNTRSHTGRVESACVGIAKRCNYPESDIFDLQIAALLHEVGMFGMPDTIRVKAPWELSGEDRLTYTKYPEVGATLLSELPQGGQIVEIIEAHAENYDGQGFPNRLAGQAIPFGSRILRIADGCDTYLMHSEHSSKLKAVQGHLQREQGRAYDPDIAGAAAEYFEELFESEQAFDTVDVADLSPGTVLAESIRDGDGHLLVREGVSLTATMVYRLEKKLPGAKFRVRRSRPPGTAEK